jgi:hypothetical protein
MIRLCKTIAILFLATLAAEVLFRIPTRDLVAILVAVMAVSMRMQRNESGDSRMVFYVSAIAAIGFLYLGQPETSRNAAATNSVAANTPATISEDKPDIITTHNADGSMTVEFEAERMRQVKEERERLLEEQPEVWRNQIQERLEDYRKRSAANPVSIREDQPDATITDHKDGRVTVEFEAEQLQQTAE